MIEFANQVGITNGEIVSLIERMKEMDTIGVITMANLENLNKVFARVTPRGEARKEVITELAQVIFRYPALASYINNQQEIPRYLLQMIASNKDMVSLYRISMYERALKAPEKAYTTIPGMERKDMETGLKRAMENIKETMGGAIGGGGKGSVIFGDVLEAAGLAGVGILGIRGFRFIRDLLSRVAEGKLGKSIRRVKPGIKGEGGVYDVRIVDITPGILQGIKGIPTTSTTKTVKDTGPKITDP